MRTRSQMAWTIAVLLLSGCDQETRPAMADGGGEAGASSTVSVTFEGATRAVALASLPAVDVGGARRVLLSAVVQVAAPGVALAALKVDDLVAADGFRASSSPNCTKTLPADGDRTARAYVDPATRNLTWASDFAYSGCMSVRNLAEVRVSRR